MVDENERQLQLRYVTFTGLLAFGSFYLAM
jgi:hypothetical protein